MLLHRVATIVFLVVGAPALAQSRTPVDAKRLSTILAEYQRMTTLKTRFRQVKVLADPPLRMESSGSLTIRRPSEVIWNVERPSPVTVKLSSRAIRITTYESGKPQETTYEARGGTQGAAGQLGALVAWLALDAEGLAKAHDVYDLGDGAYEFVPKAAGQSPFRSVRLVLGQQAHVRELLLTENSGDRLEIRFERPVIEKARP